MNKETVSFRESIRRTFIRYSLVPVVAAAVVVLVIIGFSWTYSMAYLNQKDNKQTAEELTRIVNIYYQMVDDVEKSYVNNGYNVSKDETFKHIYSRCAEFGEIGNLIILSPDREVLFSSKNTVPFFLTGKQYSDWGIWYAIKENKGSTQTVLTEKSLCIGRGVYDGDTLKCAIVYIVPGDVISSMAGVKERFLAITDKNGWIYASNTKKLEDSYGKILDVYNKESGYIKQNNGLFYLCKSVTNKGLTIYTVDDMSHNIRIIMLLIGVIVFVFMGIVLITYRSTDKNSEKYTQDIKKIETAFEAVSNGDFNVSLNTDSSKEFKTIGSDFNEMLNGLKDQIEKNKELATNAAFSQLKQLESQLNPHFLFNTLDNIRFMAKIDAAKADKMIVSLSGILRYTIKDMRQEVPLFEDLDALQYYLNILQIRFNKRFKYEINVGDDIKDCLIPKLLLQPILENAIKYGFEGREKLSVKIRGYQMADKLVFVCEDDGAGIDEERLSEIRNSLEKEENESNHYGLFNIHRRIKLMYKGDFGLSIDSKINEGCTVRIVLPKKLT
ncbi:MAG: sensor histidine kinase [Lachnospiraceae bacterium]|nr:sensor histidine kinase [Lachnospiraceae bacterium]